MMLDLFSWMLLYLLFMISGIITFLAYDLYKERKRRRD